MRWCQQNVTPKYPNFRFHHADIANSTYNRRGKIAAAQYRFPFADESFDLVLLTSVFTHLLPTTTAHYLSEISRILAPGGRVLATFYLLNDESLQLLDAGRCIIPFPYQADGARIMDADAPENAVAMPEAQIRDLMDGVGLAICTVHYGSWCAREEPLSHQDVVIAVKQ